MNALVSPLPYRNPDLPLAERVDDLLARLTLEEKLSQMTFEAQAIPRLGIPAYNYWGEALHGVARNGRATVFPQAIGMAATWDRELGRQAGAEVVQVYLEYPPAAYPAPRRALAAFGRVELAAGESRRLAFSLPPQAWVVWDEAGHPQRLPGKHRLVVGGCSPGGRGQQLGAPVPVSLNLNWTKKT